MKKLFLFLKVLCISMTFVGCNPSDDNPSGQNDDAFAENFGSQVSRNFIGQVVDTNNQPIQGVAINIGTTAVQTDNNGVFIINNATVYEKFAYVTAKKVGFIYGSRTLVPTSGSNSVKIMLLPLTPIATISSGQTSEVSLPNGTKVTFDGAFQDENGTSYTGAVQVSLYHLMPSNEDINVLMPGMLYAQSGNNEAVGLITYGMINVELRGTGGQKLNLKSGHTAAISQLIDPSQLATAPSSIPLWHFDEEKGYWKEEGSATKVGNSYVGAVSHFTWWNCDTFEEVVFLTVTIVDTFGNPINNATVNLVVNSNGFTSNSVNTLSNGQVAGVVPANEAITLSVSVGICSVYLAVIGPFSTNTVLPAIVISDPVIQTTEVVGSLVKCDGSAVTNGYVLMEDNLSSSIAPVMNGTFSFYQLYCIDSASFTLKGVDYDTLQTSDVISYTFAPTTTSIATLQACTAVQEFISYRVDNNPTVFLLDLIDATFPIGPQNQPFFNIFVQNATPGPVRMLLYGNISTTGVYSNTVLFMQGADFGFLQPDQTPNTMVYRINKIGPVGDYIDLTCEGTFEDTAGVTHTLTGVFHVIRDN